ncbi:glycosyltransferase [Flavobacterium sp.]|uniref:glycosyltransferase n=1 Tax=Flavobacterium sp. TaxID=239 RepID=UPI002A83A258|nr:glycosyltransferase [Flavobacterium sp.]
MNNQIKNKENIKVVQLIDSLEPGGAERMAVTLANSLVGEIELSCLVVTRQEGGLKKSINPEVKYDFLNKKKSIDFKALMKFKNFIKLNKIKIIHAHGSSYFFAVLLKLVYPKVKIIWHDHFGNRANQNSFDFLLRFFSIFFSGVFAVNEELKLWANKNLFTTNIAFIPNFCELKNIEKKTTYLKGDVEKRIVCLANLKSPKNHLFLLKSFTLSELPKLGWTLHFVGKDFNDDYSKALHEFILVNKLENTVYLYGSCLDTNHILSQARYGVLASTYEGFPVTLLEYGMSNLIVLSTDVGYCSKIITSGSTGFLFDTNEPSSLLILFNSLPNSDLENKRLGDNFNTFVTENYTAKIILRQLIVYYQKWI